MGSLQPVHDRSSIARPGVNRRHRVWRLGPSVLRAAAAAVVLSQSAAAVVQDRSSSEGAPAREAFLRLIDRGRVPLAPEWKPVSGDPSLVREHFTFAAQQGERVPGTLVKQGSRTGRLPAVILLHGTGGSKTDAGIVRLAEALAARGFVAVAIDGRYHGERTKPGARATEYVAAILRAYRGADEHPFLYDTVWDVMRLIDCLGTRADIDPARIGLIGISKGGMETYLTAAVDPRVAVAVPVIGVQSFRWALEHESWRSRVETFQAAIDGAAADHGIATVDAAFVRRFYDRVVPGIYDRFDAPAMLPLIAPRPLLVINGDSDPRTPLAGVRESTSAAERAYRSAHATERFALHLQPDTGHAFTDTARDAAVDWFVRWLTP